MSIRSRLEPPSTGLREIKTRDHAMQLVKHTHTRLSYEEHPFLSIRTSTRQLFEVVFAEPRAPETRAFCAQRDAIQKAKSSQSDAMHGDEKDANVNALQARV